ncbi:hypothetical protein Mpe_A3411 [Methylibium petroleiphilum PM1]|uniref:Uncharacterized protein n=1 Tax=Methylibium petroleiphilum (strain ATCC BAA-1232 / LMG 22953 / PM1) TaxID=420662 RepID=A2SLC5_METPP|nr:hypothetical protein Mpe_A3411 [Methylibium petroleiphilum PM1]
MDARLASRTRGRSVRAAGFAGFCGGRRSCGGGELLAARILLAQGLADRLAASEHLLHGASVGGLVGAAEEAGHGVRRARERAGARRERRARGLAGVAKPVLLDAGRGVFA